MADMPDTGVEWLVDAAGCDPARLRDPLALQAVFAAAVAELGLHPLGAPAWRRFPEPGGVTGVWLLTESHLACHTFPEFGGACFNLFCCRPRPDWPWTERLAALLGAAAVTVRALPRAHGAAPRPGATPAATCTA
ncbi:MAG: S-adenosylmethionine decarboxylase [Planctomycetes bacterium]|nr:S-adenosylmethionine decarboxylase [Planctomycetota bacterium]